MSNKIKITCEELIDTHELNNLFSKVLKSEKKPESIGKIAPSLKRDPKIEECLALTFLKTLYPRDYPDINLHEDRKENNSLDLYCKSKNLGIEVTRAVNKVFQERINNWNKNLCYGKEENITIDHNSDVITADDILQSIVDKCYKYDKQNILKDQYEEYKIKYNLSDVDLFVECCNDVYLEEDGLYVKGIPTLGFGYSPQEDFRRNFKWILNELNSRYTIKYRRIYIVFGNCAFCYNKNNNILFNLNVKENIISDIANKAIDLQNIKINERNNND